jgi:hypothetical protein
MGSERKVRGKRKMRNEQGAMNNEKTLGCLVFFFKVSGINAPLPAKKSR